MSRREPDLLFDMDDFRTSLWCSFPVHIEDGLVQGCLELLAGETCCAVYRVDGLCTAWGRERAERALAATLTYWSDWAKTLRYDGPRAERVLRSAATIHLMGYAPAGSSVAAPTAALPERLGGRRNYDYRYAWTRDASLSVGTLSMLGDLETAGRYMDWLSRLGSLTEAPLQVAYDVNGGPNLRQRERTDLYGYRGSIPVILGNHVYKQRQLGALGYLADCALLYLKGGGRWKRAYWDIVERAAEYTADTWRKQDHGMWELSTQTHHVSSKVMAWVTTS